MPYRATFNVLEITDAFVLRTGITIIPQYITNNIIQTIRSGITVVTDNSDINDTVKLILPKIFDPGLELKLVNLNKNFNLNIEVDDSNQTKINSIHTQITLKPLSNTSLVSVSQTDWYMF